MAVIGYARVSTRDQNDQLQLDALNEAGCERIFTDAASGKNTEGRPQLVACLDYLRAGDVLAVWKLDRLGRRVADVLGIAEGLHKRGIGLRLLTGKLAGTYTPTGEGKFFFTIIAAFAELEGDLIIERTRAGLEAARRSGKIKEGRPRVDATPKGRKKINEARTRYAEGESVSKIAKDLGISRATLYRYLESEQEKQESGGESEKQTGP